MSKDIISSNIEGLAHIGIPVSDMSASIEFYQDILGMEVIHESILHDDELGDVKIGFVKKGTLVLEFYEMPVFDDSRKDGFIDHIAIKVKDIESVKDALSEKGISFIEDEIVFGENVFENGSKWILFNGPDNERLELNEVL